MNITQKQLDKIKALYEEYVIEIYNLEDITRWSTKKTVTSTVLNAKRTNEQRVLDAIDGSDYQEGDKIRTYFTPDGNLKLQEHWANDHCTATLVEKLFKTVKIFETVLDIKQFPNYSLKRSKALLESLLTSDKLVANMTS